MPSVCNMVRITINDREVEVEEDLYGLCRLCIVEIIKGSLGTGTSLGNWRIRG
jgi:hypothetical protein